MNCSHEQPSEWNCCLSKYKLHKSEVWKVTEEERKLATFLLLVSRSDRVDAWNTHHSLNNDWHAASQGLVFLFCFHLWAQALSNFNMRTVVLGGWTTQRGYRRRLASYTWNNKEDLKAAAAVSTCRIIPKVPVSHWTLPLNGIRMKLSWRWTLPGVYLDERRGHTHFVYFPCRLSNLPRNWWMTSSEVKTTRGGGAEHLWRPWW